MGVCVCCPHLHYQWSEEEAEGRNVLGNGYEGILG